MPFPVVYFLIPFVVVVLVSALFVFFNVFHIVRFGIESTATQAIVAVYIIGFAFIIGTSTLLFSRYDWNQKIDPIAILNINTPATNIYGL